MSDICRLCLANSGSFHNLSEIRENLPISVIAMIICPIKIEIDDTLTRSVCDDCVQILLNAYNLRTVSANSERLLREIQSVQEEDDNELDHQQIEEDPKFDDFPAQDQVDGYTDDYSQVQVEQQSESEEQSNSDNFVVYEPQEEDTDSDTFNIKTSQLFEIARDPAFSYQVDCSDAENKKKSMVWNYFGNLKDNGIPVESEKNYYFCKVCVEDKQTLKSKYKIESIATSVLFNHLEKLHGLSKSSLSVILPNTHQGAEMVVCAICNKNINSNTMELHSALEHENGEEFRSRDVISNYRVNCFKQSSKNNKSIAWEYFGLLTEKDSIIIDEYHYYCRLCVEEKDDFQTTKYTKNTSTSILMAHLKNAHTSKNHKSVEKMNSPDSSMFHPIKRIKLTNDFPCKNCDKKFDSKKLLTRHLFLDHGEEQEKSFTCDYENCSKSFTLKDTLSKHIKNTHEGAPKLPCNQCPTILSSKMSLQRHINTCHLKLKTFICEVCDAAFSEAKTLKHHERKVHMGIDDKRLECSICTMKFFTQWQLNRHQITHTKEVISILIF